MHLKRYEVVDIVDAIPQIKRDLGPDAIILSTRTLHKRSGLFSLVGKPLLEVIAAADPQSLPTLQPAAPEPPRVLHSTRPHAIPAPVLPPAPLPQGAAVTEIGALRHELRHTREQLQMLQGEGHGEPPPVPKARSLPSHLAHLHEQLLTKGIAADVAGQLLEEVRDGGPGRAGGEEAAPQDALRNAMLRKLQVLGPRVGQESTPHLMVFIGPTGVSKTTTSAKLAAVAALTERKRVALITLDTYRIAATEQLKVYGNIIGTPVIVAMNREEFGRALRETQGFDVVLIDTAGRCPRNPDHMWELKALLSQPWPLEVHLVLSAAIREEQAEEMIRQLGMMSFHSLLFTKLDESGSIGSLFNLTVRTAKPLSYLTTGQRVPEDFELASPERIVDLFWHGFWR